MSCMFGNNGRLVRKASGRRRSRSKGRKKKKRIENGDRREKKSVANGFCENDVCSTFFFPAGVENVLKMARAATKKTVEPFFFSAKTMIS